MLYHIAAKTVGYSSLVVLPAVDSSLRVGPQHVKTDPIVRDLQRPR